MIIRKIIYILLAFLLISCNPQRIIVNREDFQSKRSTDKQVEHISRPEFVVAIEHIEVKSPLKEIIVEEKTKEVNEDEQIKQLLQKRFDEWYTNNRNTIKYELSLVIFVLFISILFVYWLVRLINKISPNKLGFTFVCMTLMFLILMGIAVYL